MEIATTDLNLRPLQFTDETDYCSTLADPRVSSTLRLPVSPQDSIGLEAMFEQRLREHISGVPSRLAITLKENGRFLGSIGSYPIDRIRVGLSFWLCGEYQGRGFGKEALCGYCYPALLSFGVRYIFANIASTNHASLAAVRAAGFTASQYKDDPGFGTVECRVLLDIDREAASAARN